MTTTRVQPATRKEDDRLRKELRNADMGKFKKIIKKALTPKSRKNINHLTNKL